MKAVTNLVAACCIFGLFLGRVIAQIGTNAPAVGNSPPQLQLHQILQGPPLAEVNWEKLKGRVVVLEFWNTACRPCIRAIPHLNELVERFRGKPVIFLCVSDDNVDYLKHFLERKPIQAWIALDGPFNATETAFDLQGYGFVVIVDAEGRVAGITYPALLRAEHLEQVLAGNPCSLPPTKVVLPGTYPNRPGSSNSPPVKIEVSIGGPFPVPGRGVFNSLTWEKPGCIFKAQKAYLRDVLVSFFDISPLLLRGDSKLPQGLYDVSVSGPADRMFDLKQYFVEELRTNLHITVRTQFREVDVYAMTVLSTNAMGLKQVQQNGGGGARAGGFRLSGNGMDTIAAYLEEALDKPVVDETGLAGLWAADLKWQMSKTEISSDSKPDPAKVIRAAGEQLGLALEPTKRQRTVLEVE